MHFIEFNCLSYPDDKNLAFVSLKYAALDETLKKEGSSLGCVNVSALGDKDVHVWTIRLSIRDVDIYLNRPVLSTSEKMRSTEYGALKRLRFVRSRFYTRLILSRYLGVSPRALSFKYGLYGKPKLDFSFPLAFNLAHSNGILVFALSRKDIGIDVEQIHPGVDICALRRQLTPQETRLLQRMDASSAFG